MKPPVPPRNSRGASAKAFTPSAASMAVQATATGWAPAGERLRPQISDARLRALGFAAGFGRTSAGARLRVNGLGRKFRTNNCRRTVSDERLKAHGTAALTRSRSARAAMPQSRHHSTGALAAAVEYIQGESPGRRIPPVVGQTQARFICAY